MSPTDFGLDIYESVILQGLNLSAVFKPSFAGAYLECEALALKEFCKKYGLDFLFMFGVFKMYAKTIDEDLR